MNEPMKSDTPVGSDALFGIWIPASERMPKRGQKVIACGHWSNGNQYRTMARWTDGKSWDASLWDEFPEEWWDEDEDHAWVSAGWWENSVEIESVNPLENVTHWMPLPSLPNANV